MKVSTQEQNIAKCQDTALIFIFSDLEANLEQYPREFNYSNILAEPDTVEKGYWTRGYFYNVANIPLTEEERQFRYAFRAKTGRGEYRWADLSGKRIEESEVPEGAFVGVPGIATGIAVGYEIRKALILSGRYSSTGITQEMIERKIMTPQKQTR